MSEIIPFVPKHIEQALTLWRATEHIGLNAIDDEPAAIERFLQRNVGCSFVAIQGGQLVGACLCGHDLRRAAIYHLAVSHECRRAGVGRDLIAASLSALLALGVTKCHAFVFRDNPHALSFWEPEGWVLRQELYMFSKALP